MTRLIQEQALLDTRQHVAAAPTAAAPVVDTRTIGKTSTFSGEHKGLARMVIPIHCVHGVFKSQIDRSTTLGCDGGEPDRRPKQ